MPQDFSRKMSIVIREDVASWQLTNTVGHIAAKLGNRMSEPFDTGEHFVSRDGVNFPRNSQYAIVTLCATKEEIDRLVSALRGSDLLWMAYIQEMIDFMDDDELARSLSTVDAGDVSILGVGLFGSKEALKALTGGFKLWK